MLSMEMIDQLIQLLDEGFSLNNALLILNQTSLNSVFEDLNDELNEGKNIDELFSKKIKDVTFKETFLCLYPLKGLKGALIDARDMYKQKKEWSSYLLKQLQYPLFVLVAMLFLSLFVRYFLFPEMTRLFQSFGSSVELSQVVYLSFITIAPMLLILVVGLVAFVFMIAIYAITQKKEQLLMRLLKIPYLKGWIKTYYSLKFAFYFSKLSTYFDRFYEAMHYFYSANHMMDLKPVLKRMVYELNEGVELAVSIRNCAYFTGNFKQYFDLLVVTKQNFHLLETYCTLTLKNIQNTLRNVTNLFLGIVYIGCGLYVMCLYSVMILPVLEIMSNF